MATLNTQSNLDYLDSMLQGLDSQQQSKGVDVNHNDPDYTSDYSEGPVRPQPPTMDYLELPKKKRSGAYR